MGNKLQALLEESGIDNPTGALFFSADGVLGSYGVAQHSDYVDLKDLKLTKDGYGLYTLHGHRILLSTKSEGSLAVYIN